MINSTYRLAIVSLNNQLRDHEQELDEVRSKMEAARWYLAAAQNKQVRHHDGMVNEIDKRIMELRSAVEEYDGLTVKVELMRKALRKALREVENHIEDDTDPQDGGKAVRSLIDGEMYPIVERDCYNMNVWTGDTDVEDRPLKSPVATILMGHPIHCGKDWEHRYQPMQIPEQTTWYGLLQAIRELVLTHFDNDEDMTKDMWIETIEVLDNGSCLVAFGS